MQGLFVPFACVGSGDPVRVLRLFHNKYTGYCCIHLLCRSMYNLSLPRLSANYYGLPTTVQLRAAHESRCSLFGVLQSTAQVLYCTCLERYIFGTVQSSLCRGTFMGKISASYYIIYMTRSCPTLIRWGSLGPPWGMLKCLACVRLSY